MPKSYADRGERLQAAINATSFTQASLAERLGISRQALNDLVTGRAPGARHLATLAKILDVPEGWLRDGGALPDDLREKIGGGYHLAPSPAATEAIDRMREAMDHWQRLKEHDPKGFQALLDQVPEDLRNGVAGHTWRAWILGSPESVLAALRLVGVIPADAQAFNQGLAQAHAAIEEMNHKLERRDPSKDADNHSLPLEHFATVRASLLVVWAERKAFGRSPRDIERTLEVLWRRQLKAPWPPETLRRLRADREEDLGPDLEQKIDEDPAL